MPKPEQVTGAPYPMQINGKSYRARTLSDRDYDELTAWVKWKFIEESKASLDKMSLIKEDRQEMLTSIMLAASQITFHSVEGGRIINSSTEGFAKVGWQMIHHYHPNITYEDFLAEIKGPEENEDLSSSHLAAAISSINQAFVYLNISDKKKKDKPESGEDSGESPKSD